jgi:glycosyltransferase involved in cell wall biosynthesis
MHIRHSFSDAADRCSYFTWYKRGEIYKEFRTKDYSKLNEILIYIKEFYFTIKWITDLELSWDEYIGMDGLCVAMGFILKFIHKVDKVVYWAMDFVPSSRFNNGIKNLVYHRINTYGYKHADEMWDLSPRMAEARSKFLNISLKDYTYHKVVPYGVWKSRIKKYTYEKCEKNTIVFMGHLLEKQGAQLIIKTLPALIKNNPKITFKIIGTGSYKKELYDLAKSLNVLSNCDFKGKIEDHRVLENEIAKSCVAVGPYIKKLDTWTYYADPGKIKTYLACGVPVLLTDIPWNAEDIEKNKAGIIISENIKEIEKKLLYIMKPSINSVFRKNAVSYSTNFDYITIFKSLLT